MTKQEAMRQTHQENALQQLGFSREEVEQLRRISITLQHWYEKDCGVDNGCIERDETTDKPFWFNSMSGRRYPIPDREKGAIKRLQAILASVNVARAGKVGKLAYYLQTDPRGAALYIIRPGDVPAGGDVSGYYSRGICVY